MNTLKRTLAVAIMAVTAMVGVMPAQAATYRAAPVTVDGDTLVTDIRHRGRRHRRHRRYRRNRNLGIAGALIGGAIVGHAISESRRRQHYAPRPVYRSGLSQAHIRYCHNRYRSYRASDNTFQPYGNRPRQQCHSRY